MILLLTGFELRISGVGSDHSTICATSTALKTNVFLFFILEGVVVLTHLANFKKLLFAEMHFIFLKVKQFLNKLWWNQFKCLKMDKERQEKVWQSCLLKLKTYWNDPRTKHVQKYIFNRPIPASFYYYFRPFHTTNQSKIEKP